MIPLRFAVIGVGYLGKFHAEKYYKIPNVKLVSVCDINKDRCDSLAKKYKATSIYDYKELVGKVDAVSIATTTITHHEVAKFFLNHKVHVLLEKPITTTVEEADELIELARKNHLVLQVGHLERFNQVLTYIENKLESPRFIESIRLSPFKARGTDVNVILDLMIHDIDIIQYLVNSKIKMIHAIGAPIISEYNDITNARIEFENGCIANVTASRVSIKSERKLRVFQPSAYISIDLQNKEFNLYERGEGKMLAGIPNVKREHKKFKQTDAIKDEIIAFINSILKNKPPLVSGEDGKNALTTAIAITQMVREYNKTLPKNLRIAA